MKEIMEPGVITLLVIFGVICLIIFIAVMKTRNTQQEWKKGATLKQSRVEKYTIRTVQTTK